jgi:tetratricopeptide (TPR) repeat protein
MLTRNGQVKLLDFGLACLDPGAISELETTVTANTAPGHVLGTLVYMSPEQVRGQTVDARSDIFSAGVVLYELATARRPFGGETPTAIVASILQGVPEPILRWNYEIPAEYERIVRKCLEKAPENRYQSAREIGIDLRNLQRDRGTSSSAPHLPAPSRPSRRLWVAGGLAGAAAAAGGTAYWLWPHIRSLAVLPLAHSGSADAAYLAEGVTETLINEFSRVRQLRVLARSTVYNRKVPVNDPVAAAKTLGIDAVVAGRIEPGAQQCRIALELIGGDGRQLWGKQADVALNGLASATGDLANQALDAMGIRTGERSTSSRTVNGEAFQAYLRGRYQMNKRTRDGIEKAIAHFKEAQDHDAAYAPPYAGMATALVLKSGFTTPKEVFPLAQAAAQRALELDPSLPEAHGMLGVIRFVYQWDWRGAEAEIVRSLELSSSYAFGHSNYSQYLICRKRFDEAVKQVERAGELDPLSPSHGFTLGLVYYYARQFDRAVTQLGKAIDNERGSPVGYFYRATVWLSLGKYEQAIADSEAGLKLTPDNGALAVQALAYARTGRPEKAREAIARIEAVAKERYVSPHLLAFPYLGLGEADRAVASLERAAEDRSGWVVYIGVEPKLDPLRSNPRFQRLLRLVGV